LPHPEDFLKLGYAEFLGAEEPQYTKPTLVPQQSQSFQQTSHSYNPFYQKIMID
jgi:hypothetical protein